MAVKVRKTMFAVAGVGGDEERAGPRPRPANSYWAAIEVHVERWPGPSDVAHVDDVCGASSSLIDPPATAS